MNRHEARHLQTFFPLPNEKLFFAAWWTSFLIQEHFQRGSSVTGGTEAKNKIFDLSPLFRKILFFDP
jgi:hypothetical protein